MYKRIIIAIVVIVCIFLGIKFLSSDSSDDDYSKDIKILNNFQIDIMIYGEDIPFNNNLITRKINSINSLTFSQSNKKQILILSDLNNSLNISDEELLVIKDNMDNNNNFDFYYLGTEKLGRLKELEFFTEDRPVGDYCLAIVFYEGRREYFTGVWAESDVVATNDNRETMAM